MHSMTHVITRHPRPFRVANFAQVCLSSCRRFLAQVKKIKAGILAEFRTRVEDQDHVLELALNEAEALAWQSGFPQLLFPMLAMEKAQSVAQWHAHQRLVRGQSSRQAVAV